MLAVVAVAQTVVAEPKARDAASPPRMDLVRRRATQNNSATAAAAVTAEKKLTRHAGVGPNGRRANSQPSIVYSG
jgi:hypothetical protein